MARTFSVYVCQQCGYSSSSYLGRCPECGTWGSLVEQIENSSSTSSSKSKILKNAEKDIINLSTLNKEDYLRVPSGIGEVDRVLGGGIVPGAVMLLSGDPGIGKSTLLSQLAINVDQNKQTVLYVAGEESARQIKLRIDRLKKDANLAVLNETDVDVIAEVIRKINPKLVVIDSIQTMETNDLSSAAGSVSQVREAAHRLQKLAKNTHTPIFIIGHVTKEGVVAGPRTLEHIVDVVLNLEGDPSGSFRVLRANKNRFGSVDEVGIFEMSEGGMIEVKNPSKIFLEQKVDAPGSAVTAILTGLRPVLVEIQALVTKTYSPIPRRVGTGIDNNRLQLLVAVLSKRLKLPLFDQDVFVNVTGGIRITETAADLAVCMSIVSSYKDQVLPGDSIFLSEVGLLGELRQVRQLERRVNEAKTLGFTEAITPVKFKTLDQVVKKFVKS